MALLVVAARFNRTKAAPSSKGGKMYYMIFFYCDHHIIITLAACLFGSTGVLKGREFVSRFAFAAEFLEFRTQQFEKGIGGYNLPGAGAPDFA